MTDQIKSGGGEAIYVICKYGGYYRPNAAGYTNDVTQAGRYTQAEAISHSHPNGPDGPRDGITYHLAPEVRTPAKAGEDGVHSDSADYRHTFYGILNAQDEEAAQAHLAQFAIGSNKSMLETHKIAPVRVQLSLAALSSIEEPRG